MSEQWQWALTYQKDEGYALVLLSVPTKALLITDLGWHVHELFYSIPFDVPFGARISNAIERWINYADDRSTELGKVSLGEDDPLVLEHFTSWTDDEDSDTVEE